jgi:hypothetical protein
MTNQTLALAREILLRTGNEPVPRGVAVTLALAFVEACEPRPIETAPKDGTAIWLLVDGCWYLGYYDPPTHLDETGKWFLKAAFWRRGVSERHLPDHIFGTYAFGVYPTGWQPLPEPPQ